MEQPLQTTDISGLYYVDQFVEIDCQKLYARLGIKAVGPEKDERAPGKAREEAMPLEVEPLPSASAKELPAFVTGRITAVAADDFWMRLRQLAPVLEEKLQPQLELDLAVLDPSGMYRFSSRLVEVAREEHSLRIQKVPRGVSCRFRRYIRVAVRGRAFFLSEEVQEGENEGSLVDLGGAGVRVETSVSWLRIGDELTILIESGFVDEKEQKHVSLDIRVPARVVWLREVSGEGNVPVYHVGFAFTAISMHDQDRLISFLLAYEAARLK